MTSRRVDVRFDRDWDLNLTSSLERPCGHDRSLPRKSATRAQAAIVSKSQAIRGAVAQLPLVAPTNTTVLLLGETGVGKEVFARAIHDASPRRDRPMICVNVAAIPATLFECELFGHERGAFTDAVSRSVGRFEAAHGSTLLLDEVGELSPEVQVKLLRVLEERTFERLGSVQSIKFDVRIIAATSRNLEEAVDKNQFREDLFYRLNVFPITIPPLRERLEDIPDLAWAFIDEFSLAYGKKIESIAPRSLNELQQYSWPGNVRELRHVIERAVISASGSTLTPEVPRPVSLAVADTARHHPGADRIAGKPPAPLIQRSAHQRPVDSRR